MCETMSVGRHLCNQVNRGSPVRLLCIWKSALYLEVHFVFVYAYSVQ